MLEEYILKHYIHLDPLGNKEEWRIYHQSNDEMYINYNKAGALNGDPQRDCYWLWCNWYSADKQTRQVWFQQMRNITATEIRNSLGSCATVPTPVMASINEPYPDYQQEGNNPMITTKAMQLQAYPQGAIALSIDTDSGKSDEMTQREYLLIELREMTRSTWRSESKESVLSRLFNLNAPTHPETSQGIIDAFKNGKIVIDQTKVDAQTAFLAMDSGDQDEAWREGIRGRYYGITFTDLPVADRKGYDAAVEQYRKLVKDTERKITIGSPTDGLAALLALEAWMPTAPTLH